jgi:hypothetical protein
MPPPLIPPAPPLAESRVITTVPVRPDICGVRVSVSPDTQYEYVTFSTVRVSPDEE